MSVVDSTLDDTMAQAEALAKKAQVSDDVMGKADHDLMSDSDYAAMRRGGLSESEAKQRLAQKKQSRVDQASGVQPSEGSYAALGRDPGGDLFPSLGQKIRDYGAIAEESAAGIGSMFPSAFGADNAVAQSYRDAGRRAAEQESPELKAQREQDAQEDAAAKAAGEGVLPWAGRKLARVASSPLQTAAEITGMAVGAAPGLVAGALAGLAAPVAGIPVAVGAGAVEALNALGMVKDLIYRRVTETHDNDLMGDPRYAALRSTMEEPQAKAEFASKMSSYAESPEAIVGGAIPAMILARIGGKAAIPELAALAGTLRNQETRAAALAAAKEAGATFQQGPVRNVVEGALRGGVTQAVSFGGAQAAANLGAAAGGANIDPWEGVREMAGTGLLAGGVTGGFEGGARYAHANRLATELANATVSRVEPRGGELPPAGAATPDTGVPPPAGNWRDSMAAAAPNGVPNRAAPEGPAAEVLSRMPENKFTAPIQKDPLTGLEVKTPEEDMAQAQRVLQAVDATSTHVSPDAAQTEQRRAAEAQQAFQAAQAQMFDRPPEEITGPLPDLPTQQSVVERAMSEGLLTPSQRQAAAVAEREASRKLNDRDTPEAEAARKAILEPEKPVATQPAGQVIPGPEPREDRTEFQSLKSRTADDQAMAPVLAEAIKRDADRKRVAEMGGPEFRLKSILLDEQGNIRPEGGKQVVDALMSQGVSRSQAIDQKDTLIRAVQNGDIAGTVAEERAPYGQPAAHPPVKLSGRDFTVTPIEVQGKKAFVLKGKNRGEYAAVEHTPGGELSIFSIGKHGNVDPLAPGRNPFPGASLRVQDGNLTVARQPGKSAPAPIVKGTPSAFVENDMKRSAAVVDRAKELLRGGEIKSREMLQAQLKRENPTMPDRVIAKVVDRVISPVHPLIANRMRAMAGEGMSPSEIAGSLNSSALQNGNPYTEELVQKVLSRTPESETDGTVRETPAKYGEKTDLAETWKDRGEAATDRSYSIGAERGERATKASSALSETEKKTISKAARATGDDAEEVMQAAREIKARFPRADGWAPLEVSGIEEGEGKLKGRIQFKKTPYGFQNPPGWSEGSGLNPNSPKAEPWIAEMSDRVTKEIVALTERAQNGDKTAQAIMDHVTWYRQMARRLRDEFGGFGDAFADLLGATSPNTPVKTNWDFSVDLLRRFVRGDFDTELKAYEDAFEKGIGPTEFRKRFSPKLLKQISGAEYGMNSVNAAKALVGMWRAIQAGDAPKAKNFALNLIGQSDKATIDVWAARMLQRLAKLDRIPGPAEVGVTGSHLTDISKVGGQFGFGQKVLERAASQLRDKGVNITAPDLQAVAWFLEKEIWTKNGWTSAQGEGGSFEEQLDKLPVDRYQAMATIQSTKPPTDKQMAAARERMTSTLKGDANVIAFRANPSLGMYAGSEERSFDQEVVAKSGWSPAKWIASLAKVAKASKQMDIGITRVVRPNEQNANARPGMEVYFRTPQDLEKVRPLLYKIVANGVDGFTLAVDTLQRRSTAGGQQAKEFIGIRMQYVPEMAMRWMDKESQQYKDLASGDPAKVRAIVDEMGTKIDRAIAELMESPEVVYAEAYDYDTLVVGQENYDSYTDPKSGAADRAFGAEPSRQPIADRLAEAARRLEGRPGVDEGAVLQPSSDVGTRPARGVEQGLAAEPRVSEEKAPYGEKKLSRKEQDARDRARIEELYGPDGPERVKEELYWFDQVRGSQRRLEDKLRFERRDGYVKELTDPETGKGTGEWTAGGPATDEFPWGEHLEYEEGEGEGSIIFGSKKEAEDALDQFMYDRFGPTRKKARPTDDSAPAVLPFAREGQAAYASLPDGTKYEQPESREAAVTAAREAIEQLSIDFGPSSVSGPARDLAGLRPAPRTQAGGPPVLDAHITVPESLKERGRVDLVGQVVRTDRDLAVVARVARDPRVETMGFAFTDQNGVILAQELLSSREPGYVAAFDTPAMEPGTPPAKHREVVRNARNKFMQRLRHKMDRLSQRPGVTEVKLVMWHNHPGGHPGPSTEDVALTQQIARNVPGFAFHVVLNGDKFGVIELTPAAGDARYIKLDKEWAGVGGTTFSEDSGHRVQFVGTKPLVGKDVSPDQFFVGANPQLVNTPSKLAEFADGWRKQRPKGQVIVAILDAQNKTRAVIPVPAGLFKNVKAFSDFMRGMNRAWGGRGAVAVFNGNGDRAMTQAAVAHVRRGVMVDYLDEYKGNRKTLYDIAGDQYGIEAKPKAVRSFRVGEEIVSRSDDTKVMFPPGKLRGGFYSALERAASQMRQPMKGADALRFFSTREGVKAAELRWSGLDDFLQKRGGERVTPEDVKEFLKANAVTVTPVTKGDQSHIDNDEELKQLLAASKTADEETARAENEYSRTKVAIGDKGDGGELGRLKSVMYKARNASSAAYDLYERTRERKMKETSPTKFAQYQTPGGTNYREVLLTLPVEKLSDEAAAERHYRLFTQRGGDPSWSELSPDQRKAFMSHTPSDAKSPAAKFRSSHFDEPNILAHVRLNDRVVNGKRVLFVEEVQSDWAQKGRREGFASKPEELTEGRKTEISDRLRVIDREINALLDKHDAEMTEDIEGPDNERAAILLHERRMLADEQIRTPRGRIPSAPFVEKTEDWTALALKAILHKAATEGYDAVAWTTGDMQAERYDLSKTISKVEYQELGGKLRAFDHGGRAVVDRNGVPEADLADYVGKEAAEKLTTGENREKLDIGITAELSGLDLKVGGEGMKAFYDKIVPQVAEKIGKKWGAKVGTMELNSKPKETFQRIGREGSYESKPESGQTVHSITLTDSVKRDIQNEGFALFEEKQPYGDPHISTSVAEERAPYGVPKEPEKKEPAPVGSFTWTKTGNGNRQTITVKDPKFRPTGEGWTVRQNRAVPLEKVAGEKNAPKDSAPGIQPGMGRPVNVTPMAVDDIAARVAAASKGEGTPDGTPISELAPPEFHRNMARVLQVLEKPQAERLARIYDVFDKEMDTARGRLSWEQGDKEALKLLGVHTREQFLQMAQRGVIFNEPGLRAATRVMYEVEAENRDALQDLEAAKARGGGDVDSEEFKTYLASSTDLAAWILALRGEQAEAARAFGARKDLKGARTSIEKLVGKLAGGKLTPAQAAQVIAIAQQDPGKLPDLIRQIQKPGFWDMINEWRKGAMLFGVRTYGVNFFGNAFKQGLSLAEIPGAAAADYLKTPKGQQRQVYLGEMAAARAGLADFGPAAWSQLVDDSKKALRGIEEFDPESNKYEQRVGAIPGPLGKFIRTPFRMLTAADNFFKTLARGQSFYREAYRRARNEGLTGTNAAKRADELVNIGKGSDWQDRRVAGMLEKANRAAEYETFTRHANYENAGVFGAIAEGVSRLEKSVPPIGLFAPFKGTPANIAFQGYERSPLGWESVRRRASEISALEKELKQQTRPQEKKRIQDEINDKRADFANQVSRATLGSAMFIVAAALSAAGLLTGSGPSDWDKNKDWQKGGGPNGEAMLPNAIRVGDSDWYAYDRFEPIAATVSMAASIPEMAKETSAVDVGARAIDALHDAFVAKTYLQGMEQLGQLIKNPLVFGKKWLRDLEASFVPAIIGHTADAFDPTVHDNKGGLLDPIKARIPGLTQGLRQVNTGTGEPAKKTERLGGTAIAPVNPLGFIRTGSSKGDPLYAEFYRSDYSPQEHKTFISIGVGPVGAKKQERVELTPDEMERFRRADEVATRILRGRIQDPAFQRLDPDQKKANFRKEYDRASDAVKKSIMPAAWSRLQKQLSERKKAN